MTDDVHDVSSAEPGGADEVSDARAIEESIRSHAAGAGVAGGAGAGGAGAAGRADVAVDRQLEAILMIADEPQSLVSLGAAVGVPVPVVRQAVERLVADFDGVDGTVRRGFELREVGGGWRFYVREDLDAVVEQFVEAERPSRLSQAALETLAVVAYKQPITRSQIASIRAVNVDGVVRTLVARGLIEESFTDSETGAINYVTSDLPLITPLLEDGVDGFEQNEGIPDGRV
jgi:segregation and condensation protein B